jgi:SSS family transporter
VRWRRARIDSPVEYIETRYSPFLRQLFAWHGIPVKMVDDGIKLFATATFISVCADVDIKISILLAGSMILVYTFMGGLWAVTVTDFIQFVVLVVGVIIILPLSIIKAGGVDAVFTRVPEGFFRLTSDEFGWSYIIPLVLMYALAWSSINWSLIQRYYCVPKERDALKVGWLVVVLYAIGPPVMFFPAIAARQFIPELEDAGQIYPLLCTQLLPAGMLGLAVAAMFAATMSTLSSDYNVCAGVLTNDVYRRLVRPDASQKELVLVGRIMTLVIGVIALLTAFLLSQGAAEGLFPIMVTLFGLATAPVAIPMLLGLVSRRFANSSAVLGCLVGLAVGLAIFLFLPAEGLTVAALTLKKESVLILSTSIVTLAVMMVTSAILPASASAQARIDAFLRRVGTPIGDLPEDADSASAEGAFSPFGVVGISVALIGLLMLCVTPMIDGRMQMALAGVIGLLLALIGGAVTWASRRAADVS